MKKVFLGFVVLFFMAGGGYGQEPKPALELTIKLDKEVYAVGEGISISGQIINTSNQDVIVCTFEQTATVTFDVTNSQGKKIDAQYFISDPPLPRKKDFIRIMPGKILPRTFLLRLSKEETLPDTYIVSVKYNFPVVNGYYENGKFVNLNVSTGILTSNAINIKVVEKNLSSCVEKVKFVKKGMTRKDLEKLFIQDSGLMGIYRNERYVLRDCACQADKVLKVNVSFKPLGVSDETYRDPDHFQAWLRQSSEKDRQKSEDVIINISEPYCDYSVSD